MATNPLHFNPRAPCGARHNAAISIILTAVFQSTRPLRGATNHSFITRAYALFQSTRPLRGATNHTAKPHNYGQFQSPRPLRGATCRGRRTTWRFCHFNPRAPCGARHGNTGAIRSKTAISIHAPLAGRDSKSVQITMHIFAITDKFQMFLRKMPTVRAFCFFFVREKLANFSANRPDNFCALVLRTIRSSVPRADTSACSRSVRFYSRTSCPSSKIEGCPFLGQ